MEQFENHDNTVPENPEEVLLTPKERIEEASLKIQKIEEEIQDISERIEEEREAIASLIIESEDDEDPEYMNEIHGIRSAVARLGNQMLELLSEEEGLKKAIQDLTSSVSSLLSVTPERQN